MIFGPAKSLNPFSRRTAVAVNIMGDDKEVVEGILEALQQNHRTLQQNYWRVMMQVIKD